MHTHAAVHIFYKSYNIRYLYIDKRVLNAIFCDKIILNLIRKRVSIKEYRYTFIYLFGKKVSIVPFDFLSI